MLRIREREPRFATSDAPELTSATTRNGRKGELTAIRWIRTGISIGPRIAAERSGNDYRMQFFRCP